MVLFQFRVQMGQPCSIFVDHDPIQSNTIHFGRSGSNLAKHGPLSWIRIKFSRTRYILVDQSSNQSNTVHLVDQDPTQSTPAHFGRSGSKLVKHGPFWQIRVRISQKRSILVDQDPNKSNTIHFHRSGFNLIEDGPSWFIRIPISQIRSILEQGSNQSNTVQFRRMDSIGHWPNIFNTGHLI